MIKSSILNKNLFHLTFNHHINKELRKMYYKRILRSKYDILGNPFIYVSYKTYERIGSYGLSLNTYYTQEGLNITQLKYLIRMRLIKYYGLCFDPVGKRIEVKQ